MGEMGNKNTTKRKEQRRRQAERNKLLGVRTPSTVASMKARRKNQIEVCKRKAIFVSRHDAEVALIKLETSPNYQPLEENQTIGVYQCPICNKWHVGRETRK